MTPAEAQIRAQSELRGSETLIWSGAPNARRAGVGAISETITPGIALVGFALLCMLQAYSAAVSGPRTSSQTSSSVTGPLLLASVLFVPGLFNFARPLWIYRLALKTVYAVTSHRLMIIRGNGNRSVDVLDPAEIVDVKCRERQDGSGDVMISTSFTVRTRNTFARRRWWFYGVPSAKEVAHLISELKHGRNYVLSLADRFVPLDFNSQI